MSDSSESKQLDLLAPKKDPILESILSAEKLMETIINNIAVTFMQPLQKKGKAFSDAKNLAKESFQEFLRSPQSQTEEGWVRFFLDHVQTHGIEIPMSTLASLKNRLNSIKAKNKISILFRTRSLVESVLADHNRGKNKLSAETVERSRQLIYDLSYRHF